MKNLVSPALRTGALAAALFLLPSAFAQNADPVVRQFATTGTVPVASAGPYVQVGTCRVQVSAKLGRPTTRLPDGTWLYDGFNAANGSAAGTLVVRFEAGRVRSLALATPAVVTALRSRPASSSAPSLVAAWNQQ
jgi:hypothetical protein